MAYKTDNYNILASYQYYGSDGSIHIYVAIESSPGRFKVYTNKEKFIPETFCIDTIKDIARFGGKIGKETAKRCFPLIAETYKFEG